MNRIILALASSITLAACGSSAASESTAQWNTPGAGSVELLALQGTITAVKTLASEGSVYSVAEVSYLITCTQRLESFVSSVEERNGVFTVYASALASDSQSPSGIGCLGFSTETKEVFLADGAVVTTDQVRLVGLDLLPNLVPFSGATQRINPLSDLTIISAEPLTTGTLVTLQGFRSCAQIEGPAAYAVDTTKDNTLTLAVAAFSIATVKTQPIADCLGMIPQLVRVTLLNDVVTQDEITLEILQ